MIFFKLIFISFFLYHNSRNEFNDLLWKREYWIFQLTQ